MGRPPKQKSSPVTQDDIFAEIERRIDASNILSPAEKSEIRKQAISHVEELRKNGVIEALKLSYIKAEENRFNPNEQLVEVEIDLGDYAPCITINGMMSYYHGMPYLVPVSVACTLNDIMWQTQMHQREIDGKRRKGDIARDPLNKGINLSRDLRVSATGVTGDRTRVGVPR